MVLVYILTNGGSCVAVISVLFKVTQTLGKLELGVKKNDNNKFIAYIVSYNILYKRHLVLVTWSNSAQR